MIRHNHRYRKPRLLTVTEFITHNYKHSKWRLNRAKVIERYREKPCFLHFTSSYSFRSRHNTLFWKKLTHAKILNVYLYNLSSVNSKYSIAKRFLKIITFGRLSCSKHFVAENKGLGSLGAFFSRISVET